MRRRFFRDEGRIFRYVLALFRGLARILPSNSELDGEYKTPTSFAKGGSSILKSKNRYRLLNPNTPQ